MIFSLLSLSLFVACALGAQKSMEDYRIVNLPGLPDGNFADMFSGFITVDEKNQRELFFFHVEAAENPSSAPLVIWLTGGPGCSSLLAAFDENGPLRPVESLALEREKYSWSDKFNMLWIEAPAGVGFSKSAVPSDYTTGDTRTADDNYHFLVKFIEIFDHFKGREVAITAESYGGHYGPELAQRIVEGNRDPSAPLKINLKTLAVGNAWTFSAFDNLGALNTWWTHALIPERWATEAIRVCNLTNVGPLVHELDSTVQFRSDACQAALNKASSSFTDVNIYDIYIDECHDIPRLSETAFFGGPKPIVNPCSSIFLPKYLNKREVQLAMHVGEKQVNWEGCSSVVDYNRSDVLHRSVIPIYHQLIKENMNILVYSGDVDAIVPFLGTRSWMQSLGLPVVEEWRSWHTNDEYGKQTGGFYEKYKGLSFASVRDAGHQAPVRFKVSYFTPC